MYGKLNAVLAAAVLISLSSIVPAASAADDNSKKLEVGLPPTVQLLQLMDTDKNGKISKQEFLRFMEAEFDYADKNKDGELNPRELRRLVQALNRPIKGPGR
jgi:Ca2+-binding EF-hand superfamily protein